MTKEKLEQETPRRSGETLTWIVPSRYNEKDHSCIEEIQIDLKPKVGELRYFIMSWNGCDDFERQEVAYSDLKPYLKGYRFFVPNEEGRGTITFETLRDATRAGEHNLALG